MLLAGTYRIQNEEVGLRLEVGLVAARINLRAVGLRCFTALASSSPNARLLGTPEGSGTDAAQAQYPIHTRHCVVETGF